MLQKQPDWEKIEYAKFISWKQMVAILLGIALIVQLIAQFITPTSMVNYQLLAFITATNVGAVLLAILAQRSAEDIRDMYVKAFTPSFYATVSTISNLREIMVMEAEKDGKSLDEELEDLGPKLYGFFRAYVNSKNPEAVPEVPDIQVAENPAYDSEEELFQ